MTNYFNNFTIVDLSHSISQDMTHFSGHIAFKKERIPGPPEWTDETINIQKYEMDASVGTHLDAPVHCIPSGKYIHEIELENVITNCIVLDVTSKATERYRVSVADIGEFENKFGQIN